MMTRTRSRLLDLLLTACIAALLATIACSSPPAPKRVDTDPVANAGADATSSPGETVTLDGSASRDDDGDPLTYLWTQSAENPAGFVFSAVAVIEIAPDVPGVYLFFR